MSSKYIVCDRLTDAVRWYFTRSFRESNLTTHKKYFPALSRNTLKCWTWSPNLKNKRKHESQTVIIKAVENTFCIPGLCSNVVECLCQLVIWIAPIILLCFLAHVPIGERVPLLKYRCTEVNCNIYNSGVPAFLIVSQMRFFGYSRMRQKARSYGKR